MGPEDDLFDGSLVVSRVFSLSSMTVCSHATHTPLHCPRISGRTNLTC